MADVRYNPKVKAAATIGKLTGVTFVLTGKFPDGKAALEKLIKAEGGQIVGSVSKTLKYLVCAPDSWGSSTKYVKAEKLAKDGVVIVTEAQLRELL
jgi:NAD-dependent DNA ligase